MGPTGRDRDRLLTDRGRIDATRMGLYLVRHNLTPSHASVSPAARTMETWALASAGLQPPLLAAEDDRIYEASAATLFEIVAGAPTSATAVMIVGHNPGLHELAVVLTASGELDARTRLREELPTSGLVVIDFAFGDWSQLHGQSGRLERFITPSTLEAASN